MTTLSPIQTTSVNSETIPLSLVGFRDDLISLFSWQKGQPELCRLAMIATDHTVRSLAALACEEVRADKSGLMFRAFPPITNMERATLAQEECDIQRGHLAFLMDSCRMSQSDFNAVDSVLEHTSMTASLYVDVAGEGLQTYCEEDPRESLACFIACLFEAHKAATEICRTYKFVGARFTECRNQLLRLLEGGVQ